MQGFINFFCSSAGMQNVFDWLATLSAPLLRLIKIGVIVVITIFVAQTTRYLLNRSFKKSSLELKVDPTRYTFLKHFIVGTIYVLGAIAIIYTIPSLRSLSVSLLAGAGVIAVIAGFASQQTFANIISGIFIVIFKPFRVGDRVEITDKTGIVEDITLRHTVIRDYKNRRIVIPNAIISNEQIVNSNLTDEHMCQWIDFGISYDSDIDLAKKNYGTGSRKTSTLS